MKKIPFFFILFFLFTGCYQKEKETQIITIIEEKNAYKISINYPKTGYETLDTHLSSYVSSHYEAFKKKYLPINTLKTQAEFNIDYTLYQSKSFFSVALFQQENQEQTIETFNYQYQTDTFFSLKDITNEDTVYALASDLLFTRYGNVLDLSLFQQNLKTTLFSIDQEYLYLYYLGSTLSKVYKDPIMIEIPLSKLQLSFESILPSFAESPKGEINYEKVNRIIDTNQKVIALTFDDGPSSYTKEILTILKDYDAVATFFVLGNKVKMYAETLKQSLENGNELGNHTFNHQWLTKLNDENIKKQIIDTQNILYETLGYTPTIFRPSYGSINQRVRKDIDLEVVMWNIDTMDWKYKNVDKIVDRAVRNAEDSKIILMHETYERTKEALPKILSILKEENFSFVTISELKEIQAIRGMHANKG